MSEELIEFYGRGGRAGAATAPEGEGGRPHQVRVLLTAAERDELRDRAAAVGLSVPQFLLESSLRETGTARVAVALAGSNLNQIAGWRTRRAGF
jgi:hypothetical protein